MNQLDITTRPDGDGIVRIRIAGEVDMDTAAQVAAAAQHALTADVREVRLDMAEVTFLDSTGIRTLLLTQRDAAEQGAVLRIADAHRRVVRVLELTGVLQLLLDGLAPQ